MDYLIQYFTNELNEILSKRKVSKIREIDNVQDRTKAETLESVIHQIKYYKLQKEKEDKGHL
jgi:hypothetical protein